MHVAHVNMRLRSRSKHTRTKTHTELHTWSHCAGLCQRTSTAAPLWTVTWNTNNFLIMSAPWPLVLRRGSEVTLKAICGADMWGIKCLLLFLMTVILQSTTETCQGPILSYKPTIKFFHHAALIFHNPFDKISILKVRWKQSIIISHLKVISFYFITKPRGVHESAGKLAELNWSLLQCVFKAAAAVLCKHIRAVDANLAQKFSLQVQDKNSRW